MNLVLARTCSNSCPYCFETAERSHGRQDFISAENVRTLALWARKTNLEYLSLLGGEPFLHPDLAVIVSVFRGLSPGTSLRILTGGVFKTKLLEGLSPNEVSLIFNVNEPKDYRNPKHFARVAGNIKFAIKRGFKVILGFNVWRPDFDPLFMPRLARSLGRSNFRWTVANPQRGFPSKVASPGQYRVLADRCFKMLQTATSLGIEALLDCPLPLCFFDDVQLAWVKQYHGGTASHMGLCEPIVDVTPELEAIRCFALSRLARINVTDFSCEREIQEWFLQHVDYQLLKSGCFEQCAGCPHLAAGRCYGGCLAWHQGEIDASAEPPGIELALRMQNMLDAGDPGSALDLFQSAGYWAKSAGPAYLAALAAARLQQWDEAFRQAASALDMSDNPALKELAVELLKTLPPPADESTLTDGGATADFVGIDLSFTAVRSSDSA